jgi:hypothetical protein
MASIIAISDLRINHMQAAVDRAKRMFFKNCPNKKLKHQLKLLIPIFELINLAKGNMAQAAATGVNVKNDSLKKRIRLKKSTHPTYLINKHEYFLTIQFNKDQLVSIDKRIFQDIIAHELAHLLDIVAREVVNGYYSYSNETDHDAYWNQLAKWMGCSAKVQYTLTGLSYQ